MHPGARVGHEEEIRSASAVASAIDGSRVIVCCVCSEYASDPNCVAEYEYLLRQRDVSVAAGTGRPSPALMVLETEEGVADNIRRLFPDMRMARSRASWGSGPDIRSGPAAISRMLALP